MSRKASCWAGAESNDVVMKKALEFIRDGKYLSGDNPFEEINKQKLKAVLR